MPPTRISFVLRFNGFNLHFVWDGPEGTKRQQDDRRDAARRICGTDVFNSQALGKALDEQTAQVALLTLETVVGDSADDLPPGLRRFFYGAKRPSSVSTRVVSRLAGFYLFYSPQPCVLQYLCLSRELSGFRLGTYVYRSYEYWLRNRYPTECSRVLLAAIDHPKVVSFYREHGFHMPDEPMRGPVTVDFCDEGGHHVHLDVPHGTVVMAKRFDGDIVLLPPAIVAAVTDDDDAAAAAASSSLSSPPTLLDSDAGVVSDADADAPQVLGIEEDDGERNDAVEPLSVEPSPPPPPPPPPPSELVVPPPRPSELVVPPPRP